MFQSIQVDEVFDAGKAHASEDHPSYWLAQLRRADWQELLKFVGVRFAKSTQKKILAEIALGHFEFLACEGRAEVWQMWMEMRHQTCRGLVIQFRHSETDWSRGQPEFVDLEKNEPLGFVNIAARLICKVK
jgi:hypothetical protein